MCDPVTAAVVGAGMSALQIYGETQSAKAQVAAQEQMAKNAYRTANNQMSALNTQANLAASKAVEKATQDQLRAAQAASAARVSAGEAGIAGVGVNRIVSDVGQQLSQETAVTQRNLMLEQGNIATQQENVQLGLESQIKQYQTPVQAPGLLDSVLRIGMGAMSGASMATQAGLGSGFAIEKATGTAVSGLDLGFMDRLQMAAGFGDYSPLTAGGFYGLQQAGMATKTLGGLRETEIKKTTSMRERSGG